MILYNPNELEKLQKVFPDLDYIKDKETIEGELNFCSRYEKITCNNISKWEIEFCDNNRDVYVEDVYSIRINLKQLDSLNKLPTVCETDGRIKKVAVSRRKSIIDLHLNRDGSCCLGIFPPNYYPTLYDFVTKAVYPYFVWQAYFEKYEEIPPCGECPHNLHDAIDDLIKDKENSRNFFLAKLVGKPSGKERKQLCYCGSGKKYKNCCFHCDEKPARAGKTKAEESLSYLKMIQKDNRITHNKFLTHS